MSTRIRTPAEEERLALPVGLRAPLQTRGKCDRRVAAARVVRDQRPDATGAFSGRSCVLSASSAIFAPISWPTAVENR